MRYRVKTFDSFHYTDATESDESGTFATYEEAVAEAKQIVDKSLRWERSQMKDQTDPDELYDRYMDFGDDPSVNPEPEGVHFSAWNYAKERSIEICKEPIINRDSVS